MESDRAWAALLDEGGDDLREIVDCRELADWLGMVGVGPARHCPRCGSNRNGGGATLVLGPRVCECYDCGWRGDALELVKAVKRCDGDEAIEWLRERVRSENASEQGRGARVPREIHEIREAYLAGCRPVPETLMSLLKQWGIGPDQVAVFGLRYYAKEEEQAALLRRLAERYGVPALMDAGLLRSANEANLDSTVFVQDLSPAIQSGDSHVAVSGSGTMGVFEPYDAAKVPYLVIPYYRQGRVAYLKARPLMDTSKLSRLKLPVSLASSELMPCLYNVDVLAKQEHVLLLRRELDAVACEARGLPAVACSSLSNFRPEWAKLFWQKTVVLVLEAEKAEDPRLKRINAMFDAAGVGRPKRLVVPRGRDLARYAAEHLSETRQWTGLASDEPEPPVDSDGLRVRPEEPTLLDDDTPRKQFIGTIQCASDRVVVVHRVQEEGQSLLRWRMWVQHNGSWSPEKGQELKLPASVATELIGAAVAGSKGQPLSSPPAWLTGG